MSGRLIWFQFESIDAETRFVREYLPNAWERFEASDFFETGWFWRYGQYIEYDAGPDGGIYINVEEISTGSSRLKPLAGMLSKVSQTGR
ncbi:hypothetical protein ACFQL7_24210 [Halocatena marina]|uniref:Uncharacterized protein n=1 Tax=Halocatena marina TaxID=2934937 RepID=A0ABD5YY94_9EURY